MIMDVICLINANRNKTLCFRFIFIFLLLVLALQGCSMLPYETFVSQDDMISFANENNEDLLACVCELKELISEQKAPLYRIRAGGEGLILVEQFQTGGGKKTFMLERENAYKVLEKKVFRSIEIRYGHVLFCADYMNMNRGLAYVPSDSPEDIYYYERSMVFEKHGDDVSRGRFS